MKTDYDREEASSWPDFGERRCIVCGDMPTEEHHIPPKGTGGRRHWEGALVRLCETCHRRWHRHELHLMLIGGRWHWMGRSSVLTANIWTPCHDDDYWDRIDWL